MRKIVTIHQPNFFPWLGYFDKIYNSDVFIFLDHVQFPQKGSCWGNRVKFIIADEEKWFTAPIIRNKSLCLYNEITFDDGQPWRVKFLKTLESNYRKCPQYNAVHEIVKKSVQSNQSTLDLFNQVFILRVLEYIDLEHARIIKSSDLGIQTSSTQLLIDLVKAVHGQAYLAGGGAKGYQQDALFEQNGLELIYQNFKHPEYNQVNSANFIPGLSIIDLLMNCEKEEVRAIFKRHEKQISE